MTTELEWQPEHKREACYTHTCCVEICKKETQDVSMNEESVCVEVRGQLVQGG